MALFLSDLHLGNKHCQAEKLCRFLASHRHHHTLYIVGDAFDEMRHWSAEHLEVVSLISEFGEIIYLPGNHDHLFRFICGLSASRVKVFNEGFYLAPNGKRYLVVHGDMVDPAMKLCFGPRWFRAAVSRLTTNLHSDLLANTVERRLVDAARILGADGVICGHTHHPAHRLVDGIEYLNCGDWLRSCTAIVADHELTLVTA